MFVHRFKTLQRIPQQTYIEYDKAWDRGLRVLQMMTGNGCDARLAQEKSRDVRTANYGVRVFAVQRGKPLSKSALQDVFDCATRVLEDVIVEQDEPD
jgi:hypothetical protein